MSILEALDICISERLVKRVVRSNFFVFKKSETFMLLNYISRRLKEEMKDLLLRGMKNPECLYYYILNKNLNTDKRQLRTRHTNIVLCHLLKNEYPHLKNCFKRNIFKQQFLFWNIIFSNTIEKYIVDFKIINR